MIVIYNGRLLKVNNYSDYTGLINEQMPSRDCVLVQGALVQGVWCELDEELMAMLPQDKVENGKVVFKREGQEHYRLLIEDCIAAYGPDGPTFAHPSLKETGLQISTEKFKQCIR